MVKKLIKNLNIIIHKIKFTFNVILSYNNKTEYFDITTIRNMN